MTIIDDIAAAEAALNAGTLTYTFKGKTYSLTQLRDTLLPRLRDEKKKADKAAKTAQAESEAAAETIKNKSDEVINDAVANTASIAEAQRQLDATLNDFKKGNNFVTESDVANAQNKLAALQGTTTATSNGGTTAIVRDARGSIVSNQPAVKGGSTLPLGQGKDGRDLIVTPVSGSGSSGGVSPKGKGKGKGSTTGSPVVDTSWEPKFKAEYPQYAWMFTDEMKTKYPDVFVLFKDASADPDYDRDLFARRFNGSSFYTELKASSKTRELVASIGSLSWGSGNLAKFLTTAEQMTWTGENLKQEAYKELFRKGADGKYANDLAVKEVQASSPYQKLKRIGTQFLAPMSDDRVIESLTGGISSDDVLRLARERAKAMYPHLAANIDAGLTLEDLAYDYKQMAARTLELTPEQIDMSNAKFNVALKSGEGGKERMMSTGEWEQKLRTDTQYGFQFTKTANRDATNIGLSIARAFGKTS